MRYDIGTWSRAVGLAAALVIASAPGASAQSGSIDVSVGTANIPLAGGTVPAVNVDARSAAGARLRISSDATSVVVFHARGVELTTPSSPCTRAISTAGTTITCPAADLRGVSVTAGSQDDRVDASGMNSPALHLRVAGADGADTIAGGATSTTSLDGGPGDDLVRAGTAPRNDMAGGTGSDTLAGGPGFDILVGGAGSDLLDGGGGTADSAQYGADGVTRTAGVTVTLGDGLCNDGGDADTATDGASAPGCTANGADRDRIVNVEAVGGSAGPDDLTGSAAAESLVGNAASDRIEGGGGPDRLLGDRGIDLLLGRDGIVDTTIACGREAERDAGDRAVADPDDIVHPSCTEVERGGANVGGPIGSSNGLVGSEPGSPPAPPGSPPPPAQVDVPADVLLPAQPPGVVVRPDVPPTGTEGTGAGGGDNGKTAPELQITSPVATVDRRGRVALRVRCVYRAKACTGTVTLTALRSLRARFRGRTIRVGKGAVVGRAKVSIPWGRSAPVRFTLRRTAASLLRSGRRSLRARAEVRARDSAAPRGKEARVRRQVLIGGR